MNAIYVVTMNFNFNTNKTEYAFSNRAKAESFFTGCVIDAQDSGYKKDEWDLKSHPSSNSVIDYAKFSKPSIVEPSIKDTQHITIKRLIFVE